MAWYNDFGKWVAKNSTPIKDIGGLVVGGLSAYNDYKTSKYTKGLIDLQKQQVLRGNAREEKMDNNLNEAFAQSDLNRKKKETGLVNLGG